LFYFAFISYAMDEIVGSAVVNVKYLF
jgi:hypothetical protein